MLTTLYVLLAITAIDGDSQVNTITIVENRIQCDDMRLALINIPKNRASTEYKCVKVDIDLNKNEQR